VPPIRQATQGLTNHRQHPPHSDAGTTTGSTRTNSPNGVQAGRPRRADSTRPQSSHCSARNMRMHATRRPQDEATARAIPGLAAARWRIRF
jgi:hypothetical protein